MAITPIDIQQQQFKSKTFGGYDKAGVDHFLEQLADEVERLNLEILTLRDELARTKGALDELRLSEATLKEALLTTQRVTDDLKANARREAELVITEARMRGERLVRDAEERRIQLFSEMQELKRHKIAFETGLRAVIESHLRLLDLEVVTLQQEEDKARQIEESLGLMSDGPHPADPDALDPQVL